MFIVKKKAEVIRFGLFLLLMGAMAYYVAGRLEAWRVTRSAPGTEPAVGAPAQAQPSFGSAAPAGDKVGQDFFAEFRITRERNRGAFRENLKAIMESQSADGETRKQASQQFMDLAKVAAVEARAEEMVKARGFDDAVVDVVDGTARVIIRAGSLTREQWVQVVETVSQITGVKQTAVHVSARER